MCAQVVAAIAVVLQVRPDGDLEGRGFEYRHRKYPALASLVEKLEISTDLSCQDNHIAQEW